MLFLRPSREDTVGAIQGQTLLEITFLAIITGDDLPRVSQRCITRTKFLGSGAFGEVFEGTASGIAHLPHGEKVAIKVSYIINC